jgi:hypothetical protein
MIKIAHVEEAKRLQSLPQEVVEVVEGIAEILDRDYGVDREVDCDGGYILVLEAAEELEQLKEIYIDLDEVIAEYTDLIMVEGGENFTNTLILANDYSISLILPISLTLKRFLRGWL